MEEQPICNPQVASSILAPGSMIASFENTITGDKLRGGECILLVTAKDDARIDLEAVESGRKLSLYAPEFDCRAFELIPRPPPKSPPKNK